MAARQPGAPSIAETTRMRANAETGATSTSLRYQWQTPLHDGDRLTPQQQKENRKATNDFPLVAVPKDPYDDIANIKSVFGDKDLTGENWTVPFENADAQYLLRKRDAQEKAQFDAWVMQKYDLTDPAQMLLLQNIAPELFQRREEVIDSQQALVSAYAKLRLRGAKSLSDLELEWLIETGRLQLPHGPIWNPVMWRHAQKVIEAGEDVTDAEWNAQRYRFGLFSPIKWLTTKNAGWEPFTDNRADIRGNASNKYMSPNLPYPGPAWGNQWGVPIPYPGAGSNTHNKSTKNPVHPFDASTSEQLKTMYRDSSARYIPYRTGTRRSTVETEMESDE